MLSDVSSKAAGKISFWGKRWHQLDIIDWGRGLGSCSMGETPGWIGMDIPF